MIFVEVNSVAMHAASIILASWVLLVLAHGASSAVAVAHMALTFPGLPHTLDGLSAAQSSLNIRFLKWFKNLP